MSVLSAVQVDSLSSLHPNTYKRYSTNSEPSSMRKHDGRYTEDKPSVLLADETREPLTMHEEQVARRARKRVDIRVIPCLVLMFVFLQFDRTSLGNALTDNFAKAAHIKQKDINVGQTLFTLGMVLFEIPSNILIKRVGAHRWLPLLMFAWGIITFSQMFIKSRPAYFATRFLLATFEAGFIPGAAFYLGQFYTRKEMALRYALLWASNSIAGALAGVLALGLLSLRGQGGLHGWQWLWLIEGVLTCFVSILALLHLPASIDGATRHRVFGTRFAILNQEQASALNSCVILEDSSKTNRSRRVALRDFDVFRSWNIWGHCAMAFLTSIMFTPVNTYAPSIIKSLGYKGYTANGMNSVGPCLNLIISLSLAWNSDRTKERGLHVTTGFLVSAAGLLWLALPPNGTKAGVLYAAIIVLQGGMGSVQGINAVSKVDQQAFIDAAEDWS